MPITEAIILAGGQGTRLKSVVTDIPKPMAPVNGIPFLTILFEKLKAQGISHLILSVGYRHEVIVDYYGYEYEGMKIDYAIEKEPLGTGGAVSLAINFLYNDEFLLMNGDTLFDIDIQKMYDFHNSVSADLSIALKQIENQSRYGIVKLNSDSSVSSFEEKQFINKGLINGGIYITSARYLTVNEMPQKYSWEKDILEKLVNTGGLFGFESTAYFLDIGIPEDYLRAQTEI